jgi:hypothetical protein
MISWYSELAANTHEAPSKHIDEKSNILTSTLIVYIKKKTLEVTMKIEAKVGKKSETRNISYGTDGGV